MFYILFQLQCNLEIEMRIFSRDSSQPAEHIMDGQVDCTLDRERNIVSFYLPAASRNNLEYLQHLKSTLGHKRPSMTVHAVV